MLVKGDTDKYYTFWESGPGFALSWAECIYGPIILYTYIDIKYEEECRFMSRKKEHMG